MTIVVLLVLFFFWITIPLFIISLFFGYRYRFRGKDLGREPVNRAMDSAADAADEVKRSFKDGTHKNSTNSNGTGDDV